MATSLKKILTAGNMSANVPSLAVDLGSINLGSIQAVWTGTPTGTLQLELSNDIISDTANPDTTIVNWIPYSGSQVSLTGAAGSYMFTISNMGYKWIRVNYLFSSGSGSLDLTLAEKNV